MKIISSRSVPCGSVLIPASKSHSIRAIFLATVASGVSRLSNRLQAADVDSAIEACRLMGAKIEDSGDLLTITGTGGAVEPISGCIDVGNSGTTARFLLSLAALSEKEVTIKGDESTSSRPMQPLLQALSNLGVSIISSNDGKLPITIKGPVRGGTTEVDGKTSQFISSLLTHATFFKKDTAFSLPMLNEKPYVDMTFGWLDRVGVKYGRDSYSRFSVAAGQRFNGFDCSIPADFSSATFFLALSAIEGAEVELRGLDLSDTQGDKYVIELLRSMGADIDCTGETIKVKGRKLKGRKLDLNSTPDALPALSVVAALADGETSLLNVPQARIKETDRIAVMAKELAGLGVKVKELPDGMVITGGSMVGASVHGHHDHRVVMSLAIAGFCAEGKTTIDTAEAMNITFPNYIELMTSCGANLKLVE